MNWYMNLVYQWAAYLDGLTAEALTWTAAAVFNAGVTVTADGTEKLTVQTATGHTGNLSQFTLGHGTGNALAATSNDGSNATVLLTNTGAGLALQSGNALLTGTLGVGGTATFSGPTVVDDLTVGGDVSVAGQFTGVTTFGNNIVVTGRVIPTHLTLNNIATPGTPLDGDMFHKNSGAENTYIRQLNNARWTPLDPTKAAGRITTDGAGNAASAAACNIGSVSLPGGSVLRVTFSTALLGSDADLICLATWGTALTSANGAVIKVYALSTSTVEFTFYEVSGTGQGTLINPATTAVDLFFKVENYEAA